MTRSQATPESSQMITMARMLSEKDDEIERLRGLVVMRFDMERMPEFTQGYREHEVLEVVTADQCSYLAQKIERLHAELSDARYSLDLAYAKGRVDGRECEKKRNES